LENDNKNITLSQKIKGHFLLTRPVQLIWLDIFVSLAIFAVLAQHAPNAHYLFFIACAIIADAGACTINDLGDLDSDRLSTEDSRSLRPLPRGIVTKKATRAQAIILFIIGLAIALYLDIFVFIFTLILIFISYQYSMNPLKLDARPIVGQLFWISFGFLYYFAVAAYLRRYDNLSIENFYNGLYFLISILLFIAVGETLAKDLRDLENDRAGGKNTTSVYFGPRRAVVASFTFSFIGLFFWAFPFFTVIDTQIFFQVMILFIVIFWNIVCFLLARSIYIKYTKERARELHLGFILTFTCVLTITYFISIA
jgi:4-hydroxybenzoate polyprenyltransferase